LNGVQGRCALVTGGGRGIGAETAVALAELGARVSVAARNEAQVVEVARTIREAGHEGFAFRCDVTDPHQVRDMVQSAREAMGRVDILVNNAGTANSNPLSRVTLTEWRHVMEVNATGTFLCTQAAYQAMVERGWGRIVNVASVAGLRGDKYVTAYTAAKHAVVGFTRALAEELRGSGVTVNAVCPGFVDTPLTDETIDRIMRHKEISRAEALAALLDQAGQSRLIRADEVAHRIVAFCQDDAAHRTGEAALIDAGDGQHDVHHRGEGPAA
jgi:NAD(P)-dependent dehydrogenase (short-subunit alcohol dehydrogenase family)